jgi:hypothetical protein
VQREHPPPKLNRVNRRRAPEARHFHSRLHHRLSVY